MSGRDWVSDRDVFWGVDVENSNNNWFGLIKQSDKSDSRERAIEVKSDGYEFVGNAQVHGPKNFHFDLITCRSGES